MTHSGLREKRTAILIAGFITFLPMPASSQGRGGSDWSANGGDAQRSSWVRADPKISAESMRSPGFQFMWKLKFRGDGGPLSAPVLTERYIGYRGFRTYAFIGGANDSVFTMDSDLSRLEWQKHFPIATKPGSGSCPGGMTAAVTRRLTPAMPSGAGGGGRGRGAAAKSGVGAPGEGAVTLPAIAAAPATGGRGPLAAPPARGAAAGPGRGRTPEFLNALSSDGAFHSMYISNGDEPAPPVKFLPPNANASGLIVVDGVAYAETSGNCGGVPDGLWALDIATKNVASFQATLAGRNSPAFTPDGTVYVATAAGEMIALDPKTLTKKSSFDTGRPFVSSPIIFETRGGNAAIAAAGADGMIRVFSAGNLASPSAFAAPGARGLSTWQDAAGTRWILASTPKEITAFRSADAGFTPAWTSREIPSPTAPLIVNGVIFAAASGSLSSPARLYALDAATGKELFSSANTVTSYIPANGGLSAGGSAIYFGTHDGTFWAFGFPIEH